MGHSLWADFTALKLWHANFIDTSFLFGVKDLPNIMLSLKDVVDVAITGSKAEGKQQAFQQGLAAALMLLMPPAPPPTLVPPVTPEVPRYCCNRYQQHNTKIEYCTQDSDYSTKQPINNSLSFTANDVDTVNNS